ncbi:MAG: hypothetical protein QOC74_471, partial [Pseudonocardiales bacterium]|nr:hypothetical protein [Pseudonocardiales bacterium]
MAMVAIATIAPHGSAERLGQPAASVPVGGPRAKRLVEIDSHEPGA